MYKKIDNIEKTDLPTLIIGWSKVKNIYPTQKITNKKIGDNIFWTFSEKEKRSENLSDTKNFKNYCISNLNSKYKYYFLNPFELTFSNVKNLLNRVDISKGEKIVYSNGRHLFFLIENYIFGVNADFLFNTKITTNKIKNWLKIKNFKIFEDFEIFNKEEFINKEHLIPILGKKEYEKEFIIGYIFE